VFVLHVAGKYYREMVGGVPVFDVGRGAAKRFLMEIDLSMEMTRWPRVAPQCRVESIHFRHEREGDEEMRAFWSGSVVWHLVNVPCKLYTSSRDSSPQFHQLHKQCGSRIETVRRCPKCEIDVAWEDIGRGQEVAPGEYVLFTAEELAEIKNLEEQGRGVIEIQHTTRMGSVSPIYFDRTYWVGPASKNAKAYEVLRDSLYDSGLHAVAVVTLRTRPRLCLLGSQGRLLTLTTLHYQEEMVAGTELVPPKLEVSPKECELARDLLMKMEEPFKPEEHTDTYVQRLLTAVSEKVEGGQVIVEGEADAVASKGKRKSNGLGMSQTVDLAALLSRSMKEVKGKKSKK
jgi:DNA end-binding protein Ku